MTQIVVFFSSFFFAISIAAFSKYIGLTEVLPDVGLIATAYLALVSPFISGIVTAALIGILMDLISAGSMLGLNPAVYVLTFFIVWSLREKLQLWSILGHIVIGTMISFAAYFFREFFIYMLDRYVSAGLSIKNLILSIVVTAFFTPVFFIVFDLVRVAARGSAQNRI